MQNSKPTLKMTSGHLFIGQHKHVTQLLQFLGEGGREKDGPWLIFRQQEGLGLATAWFGKISDHTAMELTSSRNTGGFQEHPSSGSVEILSFFFIFIFHFEWFFLFPLSWFYPFLLYSKVTQSHTYIHSFFPLSSIMFHYKWLDIVPCAIRQDLIAYPLQMQ